MGMGGECHAPPPIYPHERDLEVVLLRTGTVSVPYYVEIL